MECCNVRETYRAGAVHQWSCHTMRGQTLVENEHIWIAFGDSEYASCLWCGRMLGKEKYDTPCQGIVRVELR